MNKSFTLIEILVVIVVIGILSAFILIGMSSVSSSANIAKGKAYANSLRNSLLISLVSEWKLDGSSTSGNAVADDVKDSWGANNGTIIVGHEPTVVSSGCVSAHCLNFDNTYTDYVDFGDSSSLDLKDYFTIEVWLKPNGADENGYVAGRFNAGNTGYMMRWQGSGDIIYLYYLSSGGTYSSTAFVDNNVWVHAVITFSNGNVGYFRNGIAAGTSTGVTISNAVGVHNTIGNRWSGDVSDGHSFQGAIDEVRIYNQAIPTSEIQQNYFLGLNSLFKNEGLTEAEFNQRVGELKSNLVNNE